MKVAREWFHTYRPAVGSAAQRLVTERRDQLMGAVTPGLLAALVCLENHPREQIQRVVPRCPAAKAVIIGFPAVELVTGGVLQAESRVLPRIEVELTDEPVDLRVAVRAAAHGRRRNSQDDHRHGEERAEAGVKLPSEIS